MVLFSMGGMPFDFRFLGRLHAHRDVVFVIPGAGSAPGAPDNVRVLPFDSPFLHPDLVRAADAVVGKAGYSTVAEVFRAGVPMGYVPRSAFPESPVLESFIESRMRGIRIDPAEMEEGGVAARIPELLELPRESAPRRNGAAEAAAFLAARLLRG